MTKEVREGTMIRSKLTTIFLKDKNQQSRNDYRKPRNLCVTFLHRVRKQYLSSLDLSLIANSNKIWGTIKPFFFS